MSEAAAAREEAIRLLKIVATLPTGEEEYLIYKEVARLREIEGNLDELYYAKLMQAHVALFTGHELESLTLLAWALSIYEQNPDLYRHYDYLLFRVFTNNLSGISQYPQLSLDQAEGLIRRLERAFSGSGRGARELAFIRMSLGEGTGDPSMAEAGYQRLLTLDRDPYSRCEACEADGIIEHHLFQRDFEQAIKQGRWVLDSQLRCAEVPHRTLAYLLRPLALLGHHEEADRYQRRGYRLIREGASFLKHKALHIAYLLHRDRPAAAINVVERDFAAANEYLTPLDRLYFLSASRHALEYVARRHSVVRLTLPSSLPGFQADGRYALPPLLEWLKAECQMLCDQFDARNGNRHVSEWMETTLRY